MSESTSKPSRRQFLQMAAVGAAGASLPACAAAPHIPPAPEPDPLDEVEPKPTPDATPFDVAIVGGGIAGCYVAYRLLHGTIDPNSPLGKLKQQNGGTLNVGLFEYAGRLGGRLLSVELPEVPSSGDSNPDYLTYTEFGGFRFQEQMHIVRDLATLLKLDHQPFPVDEPVDNPVYVRHTRLTWDQVNKGEELPYDLSNVLGLDSDRNNVTELDIAQGMLKDQGTPDLPTYIANKVFAGVLPNQGTPPVDFPNGWNTLQTAYQTAFNDENWATVAMLREEYEAKKQIAEVGGRLFTDWSFWALQTSLISQEAVSFLEDTGGYNSLYSAGNGPTGLLENFYFSDVKSGTPLDDPCKHTTWKHITTGYDDMPNQLHAGFEAQGGQTFLNHQLIRFDNADGGGYDLLFFKRERGTYSASQAAFECEEDPKNCLQVSAKFLVLALPKRSLELLEQDTPFFRDPTVNQLLDTVINVDAMRIFMAYREPWWKSVTDGQLTCGRSTTDLPVRQFYYWLTSENNEHSVLLASYVNGQAEEYWQTLQQGASFDDLLGARVQIPPRIVDAQGHGPRSATETMAMLAHRQIAEVVGADLTKIPKPFYAHFQNWTKDPWGGGWHAWSAGSNDDELIPQILQPLPEEHIYICGECWSNIQGWVQGALNTSEVMLQNKLGLTYPSWLQRGGTWLGPGTDFVSQITCESTGGPFFQFRVKWEGGHSDYSDLIALNQPRSIDLNSENIPRGSKVSVEVRALTTGNTITCAFAVTYDPTSIATATYTASGTPGNFKCTSDREFE